MRYRIPYTAGSRGVIVLLLMLQAETAKAQGYQVQPMIAALTPTGPGASVRMVIKNAGAIPITLELQPFRVVVSDDGTPERTAEDRDIVVFPPQTILPPGREQAVQVRYVGDPAIDRTHAYGIKVAQLPVAFGKGETGKGAAADVKISFSFLSHLFVSPPGAKGAITVQRITRAPDGSVQIAVSNDGNGVVLLNEAIWTVSDTKGHSLQIANKDIKMGNFSAMMPHQARLATLPATDVAKLEGELHASVRLP